MGKILETRKRKKKGRPSLLDLQKRTLKQQQQLRLSRQYKQHPNTLNPNSNISTPHSSLNNNSTTPALLRRSSRRIPTSSSSSASSPETLRHEDAHHARLIEKRSEKKLNLVLKLPSSSQKSNTDGQDDDNTVSNQRNRKIKAIGDGFGLGDHEKEDKSASATNRAISVRDSGTSTPLPDKKLLQFVLDRLQKKDTYGVFSEPVDLNELPDYHEVIEHPMDFGTVRMKLSSGSYTNLEQFEKDVLLICSNAMQYNAPDTIYFRQARSIQELAKKSFQNLRQDSDDNEPEPKVVRRGRPPTKNIKKLGRPPLDCSGSEFSSDATLASGAENPIWSVCNLGKGPCPAEKCGIADLSGRSHGSQNDAYRWTGNKYDRNDEGSMSKGISSKHGKKLFALDASRRNTYKQFHPSVVGRGQAVLTTFDAERKQLMAVGLLLEHGYARSLARFAANVGAGAWEIAAKRIKRSLVPGVKFGPGWVVENDIPPHRLFLHSQ